MSSSDRPICQICSAQPQKYSCPRCNLLYCSVACYRAESHRQCSENFYKECVVQEMQMLNKKLPAGLVDTAASGGHGSAEDAARMFEILKRMESGDLRDGDEEDLGAEEEEELDSDDEEIADNLAERLKDIDLDNADDVWARLTDSERQEFEQLVQSEDISTVLEIKQPWWTKPESTATKPLIVDLANPAASSADTAAKPFPKLPPILTGIQPLSQLSTKPPAPCVRHNLCNVLAAYALTYRYFNGDHLLGAAEASSFLLQHCANLRQQQNFDETEMAVQDVQPEASAAEHECIAADVQRLVLVEQLALAALSDVHRLLGAARKVKPVATKAAQADDESARVGSFSRRFQDQLVVDPELVSRQILSAAIRKIEYYVAFVQSNK